MMRIYIVLLLLCHFFSGGAQDKNILGKGIAVGEQVPDVWLTEVQGLSLNGQPRDRLRLSELRGRVVILDFFATWCGPCRTALYRLDSLQRVFGDRVLILPVAYESRAVVAPVLAAMQQVRPFALPLVSSDTVLHALFPHRTLPHEVWLDGRGVVRAVTGQEALTTANLRRLLAGEPLVAAAKQDLQVAFDRDRPLLLGGNGGDGAGVVWHSVLSGYLPGIGAGLEITAFDPLKGQRFVARNAPLQLIYGLAFGDGGRVFPRSRVRLEVADRSKLISAARGPAYLDWLAAGNGWCYELLLPPHLADSGFQIMRQELQRLFPAYRATVEKQVLKSLVLVRTDSADRLRSTAAARAVEIGPYAAHIRKGYLADLLMRLERQYLQGSALPVADGTGYTGPVDLDITAPLSDVTALNRALAAYGLAFVEKDYPAEILVIRDTSTFKP